jgi:Right handed beta helix region
MKKFLRVSLLICYLIVNQHISYSQAKRTWVSGVGDDANPCSRTAPCKTFAGAISKTANNGEISVLDPGGFGEITITKSITLNGDGTLAGILSTTTGVVINAGVSGVVVLRNISINGGGDASDGIKYVSGKHVVVENCVISGFKNNGILATLANKGRLVVRNSKINDVKQCGVKISSTGDSITAFLDHVSIQSDSVGVEVDTNAVATLHASSVTNSLVGVRASKNGAANLDGCQLLYNDTGVQAVSSASIVRISDCTIMNNNYGIGNGLGTLISFGNNHVAGNKKPITIPISVLKSQ